MKKFNRFCFFLLAVCMILSASSCGKEEEKETEETATETALSTEDAAEEDEKFLTQFLSDYWEGKYDDAKKFRYEDLSVYFDLASYKGITYPDDPLIRGEVTDEEVESYLTQLFLASEVSDDEYTEFTDGVIQKYDMVTLDYRGVIDGKEIENATATDQSLLIGSGSFIDGFEEGLEGKKIGEEVVLNLTFSPYYSGKEVAGKDITFYTTVKKVQRPNIPEFEVDVVNEIYSSSFETMDEARAWLKSALTEAAQNNAYSYLSTYLQNDVISRSTVKSYPEKELEYYREHYTNYYAQYMTEGQTWEDFCNDQLGITYDQFKEAAEEYAKEFVSLNLMVRLVAQKENITCTDEQMRILIEELYAGEEGEYYGNLKSMVVDYIEIYGADYFENQLVTAAVLDFLQENAVKEAV